MRYSDIKECDIANGVGNRVSIFVSGCSIHCDGCFNKNAHDFDFGVEFTENTVNEILDMLKPDYIRGLSVLGGEPLDPHNIPEVLILVKRVRTLYPEKDIWVYSGYTFEKLLNGCVSTKQLVSELLDCIDVLVDGPFMKEFKDLSLRFRGSSNQRIIDVRRSIKEGAVYERSDNVDQRTSSPFIFPEDELLEPKKEDDCCMTATTGKVVYVVGNQKPEAEKQPKADAKRIAEAVARTAKYVKK